MSGTNTLVVYNSELKRFIRLPPGEYVLGAGIKASAVTGNGLVSNPDGLFVAAITALDWNSNTGRLEIIMSDGVIHTVSLPTGGSGGSGNNTQTLEFEVVVPGRQVVELNDLPNPIGARLLLNGVQQSNSEFSLVGKTLIISPVILARTGDVIMFEYSPQ